MNQDLSKDCIKGDLKIKVIQEVYQDIFEKEINEFIKDKMIVDIKYSTSTAQNKTGLINSTVCVQSALIMYKEYPF